MVQTFNYSMLTPEEKQYLQFERKTADMNVKKGQHFINSNGRTFYILEDSPSGNVSVHVRELLPNGHADLYVSKTILI